MLLTGMSAALIALAAGCGDRQAGPVRPVPELTKFDLVWGASQDVVREYGFREDRSDRRAGLITTFPVTGKSWFELHREDAATARDAAESSIQTIYRSATVRVLPDGDDYRTEVRVAVSRSNRPYLQVTNTSEAYRLFLEDPGSTRRRNRTDDEDAVVPPIELPDDEALAAKMQADIQKRLAGE